MRPYPKAGARKKTSRNKCKTIILTNTHVKKKQRENRKTKKPKSVVDKPKTKRSKKTTVLSGSDASDDEEIAAPLIVDDSDDYKESFESDFKEDKQTPLKGDVKNGDFILAKYSSKSAVSHFIGEVLKALNEDDILEAKFPCSSAY